ncbi:MAG TPA: hypothetical protein VNT30_21595 [Stellaceae bacterium]|nr:hypothetical protein [Stellaceae bacterium]
MGLRLILRHLATQRFHLLLERLYLPLQRIDLGIIDGSGLSGGLMGESEHRTDSDATRQSHCELHRTPSDDCTNKKVRAQNEIRRTGYRRFQVCFMTGSALRFLIKILYRLERTKPYRLVQSTGSGSIAGLV